MVRPRKPKQCQFAPLDAVFKPRSIPMHELEQVVLPLELMEAVRLCDLEGLDQLEAGRRMGVSRGTVQRYVKDARRRIVDALVHAKALVLESPPTDSARRQGRKGRS